MTVKQWLREHLSTPWSEQDFRDNAKIDCGCCLLFTAFAFISGNPLILTGYLVFGIVLGISGLQAQYLANVRKRDGEEEK